MHKNGLKTTQNPQKQPPGVVLKKIVLKTPVSEPHFNKVAETPS